QVGRQHGQQVGVAARLAGQGIGERHPYWAILGTDQQINVGYLVAIPDQRFADVHGHGLLPPECSFRVAQREGLYTALDGKAKGKTETSPRNTRKNTK